MCLFVCLCVCVCTRVCLVQSLLALQLLDTAAFCQSCGYNQSHSVNNSESQLIRVIHTVRLIVSTIFRINSRVACVCVLTFSTFILCSSLFMMAENDGEVRAHSMARVLPSLASVDFSAGSGISTSVAVVLCHHKQRRAKNKGTES